MPKDYYDDAASAPGAEPATTTEEAPPQETEGKADESQKPEETDQPSDLVNKALLAGKDFKVGDEVVFKIVAFHGDQVEVQYAPEKAEGGEGGETEGGEPEGEDSNPMMSKMYS